MATIEKEKNEPVAPKVDNNNKFELMGKLWLRNEVKTLESKVNGKPAIQFTPFLVIDTLALIDHGPIVKALVKTKKFVVLIPSIGKLFCWLRIADTVD